MANGIIDAVQELSQEITRLSASNFAIIRKLNEVGYAVPAKTRLHEIAGYINVTSENTVNAPLGYSSIGGFVSYLPSGKNELIDAISVAGCWDGSDRDSCKVSEIPAHIVYGKYIMTFDANGGECEEKTRAVPRGECIGTLPIPTKEEHTYIGWFTQQTGGEQVLATYAPASDMTCYARYKPSGADCSFIVTDATVQAQTPINVDKITIAYGGSSYSIDKPQYVGGYITVKVPPNDEQFSIIVEKENYITYQADTRYSQLNKGKIALSPIVNGYRVVVTWEATPRDMDSHCYIYNGDYLAGHVYYVIKEYNQLNTKVILDTDDVDGYGPETVTISPYNKDLKYQYKIHRYSTDVSRFGNATVKLYAGDAEVKTYTCSQPQTTKRVWHVFNINKNGIIEDVNTFSDNL